MDIKKLNNKKSNKCSNTNILSKYNNARYIKIQCC